MLVLRFNGSEEIYHVEFAQSSTHVTSIISQEDLPQTAPGFKIYQNDEAEYPIGDYSGYTTMYRYIDKNNAQYSDDGSQYVAPTKDVVVEAKWNDQDNLMQIRPASIIVDVYTNGKRTGQDELKPSTKVSKDWKVIHHNKPLSNEYTITAPDLPRYEKSVSGTCVTYTLAIPSPRQLNLQEVAEVALDNTPASRYSCYAALCEQNQKNFFAVPEDDQPHVETIINADGFTVNEDGTVSITPFNVEGE